MISNKYYAITDILALEKRLCNTKIGKQNRLWSIAEIMERFYAPTFANTMAHLAQLTDMILFTINPGNAIDRALVTTRFQEIKTGLSGIRFSQVLIEQINRTEATISRPRCGVTEMGTLLVELFNNIIIELSDSNYYQIPQHRLEYYMQVNPLFGVEVADKFPSANLDISAAGRCVALDEWTASVFHLMRVLEVGLRDMAKTVGLDESAMSLENWKTIIDQIERQIRSLEQAPKNRGKSEKLQFYSEAASTFRYIKDAWRNHVSHSHANYSERDVIIVFNNVKSFMQTLAKHKEVVL